MATIDDKLKMFAKIVFERVEKESKQKVADFDREQDEFLEAQKKNIIKESENHIKQTKKKAEDKKRQILSKANIERQHMLLKKRKEIFDRTVEEIKALAVSFSDDKEYTSFLEKCVVSGISRLENRDILCLFTWHDIEKYSADIDEMMKKYCKPGMSVKVQKAGEEILGGCILEDGEKTLRIDCSMASMIEDNKGFIGSVLMDNLR